MSDIVLDVKENLPQPVRERLEKAAYARGHNDGFIAGLEPNYKKQDGALAQVLDIFVTGVQIYLRESFDSNIGLRFKCDSKNSRVSIAVIVPTKVYMKDHKTIYARLFEIEKILEREPAFSYMVIETPVITFSEEIPLDSDAIEADFPYSPNSV